MPCHATWRSTGHSFLPSCRPTAARACARMRAAAHLGHHVGALLITIHHLADLHLQPPGHTHNSQPRSGSCTGPSP